MRGSTNPA